MNNPDHTQWLVAQLGKGASAQCDARAAAREFLAQLGQGQELATRALQELCVASPQPEISVDQLYEARRMATLVESMRVLLDAGANPMDDLDGLMEGHADWVRALLWEIASQWETRNWSGVDGENPLHVLARGGCELLRPHSGASFWWPCPASWARQGRPSDGMTPLHVLWSQEGLAGKVMEWATHASMSWMAYEVLEEAIVYSRWLIEAQHASWDDMTLQGERAGATLLRGWDGGVGHWLPNVGGVEWIEPVIEHQRGVERALDWRKKLNDRLETDRSKETSREALRMRGPNNAS